MADLSRDFVADLEIRSDGSGRTITGIVVPFGVTARVSDGGPSYDEGFRQGAFTKTLAERRSPVKLLAQHNRTNPIGKAEVMREDAAGLYGEFRVSNTPTANEQLELARDGVLDSFSVGFAPIKHVQREGVTWRTEVALREASLVTFAAYEGALVTGIRAVATEDVAAVNLLAALFAAGEALDPIMEALCASDMAMDQAQAFITAYLGVDSPDVAEDAMETDSTGMGDMAMSSTLTSLARRLDAAIAARASATPTGAGADEPPTGHSGRLTVVRNNLRAALIERGISA